MLRTFVFLAMLSSAAMARGMTLVSLNLKDGWNDELNFWGRTMCRTGVRRSFDLHESPNTDSSVRLRDFFGALVTRVQADCGASLTITASSVVVVAVEDNPTDFRRRLSEVDETFTTNPPDIIDESDDTSSMKPDSESYLFPHGDAEIVVTMDEYCERVLMDGSIFDNWNKRRYVFVLVISTSPRESPELLTRTIARLSEKLWLKRRVLNVYFAAPLSTLGRRVWFYDPFFKNATSGVRGKLLARPVDALPFVDRVKDLKGHRLNVGIFDAQPAAIKYDGNSTKTYPFARGSQHFVGIDGLTMATVARSMNFGLNVLPPSDGIEFGYVSVNGTLVGTIGDAAYHRIDIGFNSMYMKIYEPNEMEANTIELTAPIDFDRLCVVVPRARKIPRWLRTFHYLHPAIWVCLILTQILVSFVWYLLQNFDRSSRNPKRARIGYDTIVVDTFLVFIGAPVKLNPSQAEKVFLSAFLLFGITVMGMFAGTLYHSFTSEMRYREMSSLKDVDNSEIAIGTTSPNLQDVFGLKEIPDDSDEVRSLRRKFKVTSYINVSTIERTAYQRNIASLSRENSFRVIKHRYVDADGDSLLHLVRDCPRAYYLSYVVPKDSPYIDRLNNLIMRLREAGLPQLWNSVTTNQLITSESTAANKRRDKSLRKSFNMRDMQTAFLLLLMGYVFSFCVLIGEITYHRRRKAFRTRGTIRREK